MDVSHEDKSIPTPVVEFRHLTDKGVPSKGTPPIWVYSEYLYCTYWDVVQTANIQKARRVEM